MTVSEMEKRVESGECHTFIETKQRRTQHLVATTRRDQRAWAAKEKECKTKCKRGTRKIGHAIASPHHLPSCPFDDATSASTVLLQPSDAIAIRATPNIPFRWMLRVLTTREQYVVDP